ncbi:hypothetical protein F66182_5032 [Fusarium sp. NRRL 66182]|nr:hypothetical protein F66182_5032 [Fusarium sp. NRRL 66182]
MAQQTWWHHVSTLLLCHLHTPASLPQTPIPVPGKDQTTGPDCPMSSKPSTPDGDPDPDPMHSTYEVNVPVRNGRSSDPQASNPEIRIPRIKPVDDSTDQQPEAKSTPKELAAGLDGKYVDEFGNILDWDGTVLGRVEGDLPSMVGRPVAASGEVLDEDGEVAGHVCDNYIKPAEPHLKPLGGGLQVDDEGIIYDDQGNKVGKLDKPMQEGSEKEKQGQNSSGSGSGSGNNSNAPKQTGAPRPDELYLDVKSTFDGIQLIIKIPTVFNSNLRGRVSDSASQTDNR